MSRSSTPSWNDLYRDSAADLGRERIRRSTPGIRVSRPSRPEPRPSPVTPPPSKRRARSFGRYALGLAAGLGLTVVFVGTFAAGALLHLNLPASRRAVAKVVSDVASKNLRGRIEVRDLQRVGLHGLDVGRIEIRDPQGRPVIVASGAHVRLDVIGFGRGFLGAGPVHAIDAIVVDQLDVALIDDGTGAPTLPSAFAPKTPSAPTPPDPNGLRLALADVDVRDLRVVGRLGAMKLDVHGDLHDTTVFLEPEGTRLAIGGLALDAAAIPGVTKAPARLQLATEVRLPSSSNARYPGVELHGLALEATLGGARALVSGDFVAGRADLRVAGFATPADVAGLLGGPPPVWAPVDVRVALAGNPEAMDVDAIVGLHRGDARVRGRVDLLALQATPRDAQRLPLGVATIDLRGLELQTIAPTAPALVATTSLTVHATSTVAGTELALTAGAQPLAAVVTDPFQKPVTPYKGETIVAVEGKALIGKGGAIHADGALHASVERARADVDFRFDSGGSGNDKFARASAKVHAELAALSAFKLIPLPVRGGATVDLDGQADLVAHTFTATGGVRGLEIIQGNVKLPSVVASIAAQGTFEEPQVTAQIFAPTVMTMPGEHPGPKDETQLRDLRVSAVVTKRAIGLQTSFTTPKDQKVSLDAQLVPTPTGLRVVGIDAKLARRLFRAELKVRELTLVRGDVKVAGLLLSSTAGGMRLDAAFSPKKHTLDLDVRTTELDLNSLAYGLGYDLGKKQAFLTLDAELKTVERSDRPLPGVGPGDANGALQIEPDAPLGVPYVRPRDLDAPVLVGRLAVKAKGELETPPGVAERLTKKFDGALELTIDDRVVGVGLEAAIKDIADVSVHGGAALAGRWDDPKAWLEAIGHADVNVPDVDLAKVSTFVTQLTGRPLGVDVTGTVSLATHVERPDPKLPPVGWLDVQGKKIAASGPNNFVVDPTDFDVRARLHRSLDPGKAKDDMVFALGAEVTDAVGKLLSVDFSTHAPWPALADLTDGGDIADDTLGLPLYLRATMPPRPVAKLPTMLRTAMPIDGTLGVALAVNGTAGKPDAALDVTFGGMKAGTAQTHALAVHTTYDGEVVRTDATIARENAPKDAKPELDAKAEVKLVEKDLLNGGGAPDWSAKLDASLNGVPLALFSNLAADEIGGVAFGEIHVDHVNDKGAKAPTANVTLDIDELTIGDAVFDNANAKIAVDDKHAALDLTVAGESGNVAAKAEVPLQWKTPTSPALAENGAVAGTLKTEKLRLRVAEPFVTAVDQLDGLLDSDVKLSITPRMVNGKLQLVGGPEGTLKIHEGSVIVGAIGEPWSGIEGEVRLSPTKVEIPSLVVHGRTGQATLAANATLENLVPKTVHLELTPKRLPFASNGVPIGEMSGRVTVDGKMAADLTTIDVTIDPMTVDLAPNSDKHPQDLEAEPSIVIEQPVEQPKAPPTQGGTPMKIAIHMPSNVWIRRDDMHVAVSGEPTLTIKDVARFGGEVHIDPATHGWVDVVGKRFLIDHANVRFDGSAELDPTLDIAVKWQARDGSDVTIAVGGRLKEPKVTMTADPPATQAEIMSLLVLGRRDAGNANQQDAAQRGAAQQTAAIVQGMTGAILGQQLQKMLPTSMSLNFQPGDSGFSDAKYAGGYQWKNVYFEVGYRAGSGGGATQTPSGAEQTSAKTTFGIDWRFKPTWSLMTTLGDTGSALVDLLWNYRY